MPRRAELAPARARYFARLQVTCSDEALSSPFLDADAGEWAQDFYNIFLTAPFCEWTETSGRQDEMECADGAFCPMDNSTCCAERGGVARCAQLAPVMCKAFDCAGGQDRCCATDCSNHEGPRPCARRERVPADTPGNFSVQALGADWAQFGWNSGVSAGDCVFQGFRLEWRAPGFTPGFTWNEVPNDLQRTAEVSFNFTDLPQNLPLEFRISEACTDAEAVSGFATLPQIKLVQDGEWLVNVGTSTQPRVEVDVLIEAHRCLAVEEGQVRFSVCYLAATKQFVTVTRVDLARGWGDALWMRCVNAAAVGALPAGSPVGTPLSLGLGQPRVSSIRAQYAFQEAVGPGCECATPDVQYQLLGTGTWTSANGACSEILNRECTIGGLQQDSWYYARVQVTCLDPAFNSAYAADGPTLTAASCPWLQHSGRLSDVQCGDGTLCALANETCCNGRGGRAHCPQSEPVMCSRPDLCADGQDRCCSTDCPQLGDVPRPCLTPERQPADTAQNITLSDFATLEGSDYHWLLLNWDAGPDPGDCYFNGWRLELKAGDDPWAPFVEIAGCPGLAVRDSPGCNLTGISPMESLRYRLTETCIDVFAESAPYVTPTFRLVRQGEWETLVGSSGPLTQRVVVQAPPSRCWVSTSLFPGIYFSICPDGPLSRSMTVMHSDEPKGWTEMVWVRCSVADTPELTAGNGLVRAAPPSSVQLFGGPLNSLGVRSALGAGIGSCSCAVPELQVKELYSLTYEDVSSTCADMTTRQCQASGLQPDSWYHARMRVVCSEPDAVSDWTYTVQTEAGLTLPYCTFLGHSGRDYDFECVDGSFCPMTNETCCNERGGRLRCPKTAPRMCSYDGCADGQDYCCAADCVEFGGLRPCDARLRRPADTPVNFSVVSWGWDDVTIAWDAGADARDCRFLEWRVDYRLRGGDWQMEPSCGAIPARASPSCNVSGLLPHAVYEVRVRELCTDGLANSAFVYTAPFLFAQPGEWEVYVGSSMAGMVEVDTLAPVRRCQMARTGEGFSICYRIRGIEQIVTVNKMSSQSGSGGWGDELWLRCIGAPLTDADAEAAIPATPASVPESFVIKGSDVNSITMRFFFGDYIGTCACAVPHVQIREEEVAGAPWRSMGGECADVSLRECAVPSLDSNTLYGARVQIACDDPSLTSPYLVAPVPRPTLPACARVLHSGLDDEFICADRHRCDGANATCCDEHEGVFRCPPSAPLTCMDMECATDCVGRGGLYYCNDLELVPAKEPHLELVQITTSSARLLIRPNDYIIGSSHCDFAGWKLEIAAVEIKRVGTGPLEWRRVTECFFEVNPRGRASAPDCVIEDLESMSHYRTKLTEPCFDSRLDSQPTVVEVLTLPQKAGPPLGLLCSALDNETEAQTTIAPLWTPGPPRECTFVAWQVQVKLAPDSILAMQRGSEGALPEGTMDDWTDVCRIEERTPYVELIPAGSAWNATLNESVWSEARNETVFVSARSDSTCFVPSLRPGFTFEFRVAERCTDPRADSDWAFLDLEGGTTCLALLV